MSLPKTTTTLPLTPPAVWRQLLSLPVWWYQDGLLWLWHRSRIFLKNTVRSLNIYVWIRYLFVPMFGENNFSGRIISFCMRCLQIVGRSLALVGAVLLVITVSCIWLSLPFLILYLLIQQIL